MSKNIFSQTKDYVKQPKRNVFDLSFQNNLTMEFGKLYPVFCKEVIPGDSFRIRPTFALRLLPLVFPVQTRMQANLHFFYVRNRNLWKNWTKFIGHTDPTVVPPYLAPNHVIGSQQPSDNITTRGLADYLGVPTTVTGSYASTIDERYPLYTEKNGSSFSVKGLNKGISDLPRLGFGIDNMLHDTGTDYYGCLYLGYSNGVFNTTGLPYLSRPIGDSISLLITDLGQPSSPWNTGVKLSFAFLGFDSTDKQYKVNAILHNVPSVQTGSTTIGSNQHATNFKFSFGSAESLDYLDGESSVLGVKTNIVNTLQNVVGSLSNGSTLQYRLLIFTEDIQDQPFAPYGFPFTSESYDPSSSSLTSNFPYSISVVSSVDFMDITQMSSKANPYNGSVKLSALPFRAYESIYNAFYRNEQNDPLIIDGKPSYDVYSPNTGDGSDDYDYRLHYRNWEPDFLTSAVQSPQQGIAPLVGVSSSGDFTFVNKDPDGNVNYFTAKANLASDGNTITGFQLSDKVKLKGVDTTTTGDMSNVPDSVKRGTIYSLNQMALAGISINDFRNVNSLQRWLETNIRRGYKYRDQLKSHFGVDVKYEELDMPEFIGGMSEPIYINQVNQTVGTESEGELGQPLGSYAGQGSVMASSDHSITQYCDEHGFIIGILSVSPVPNYSQLLPKMFIKNSYLDYFFPEFGHIGMQPIDYREVCPLQVSSVGDNLTDTFGYQRPWYDYIASVDEVHGQFRTDLRNFLCNRVFNSKPVLNHDFLKVDPQQLNQIFSVTSTEDKILGQIYFDVSAKRPIPRMGIPRLE